MIVPQPVTAAWLNSLSDADKIEFARSDWVTQLHRRASQHVTFLCWNRLSLLGTRVISNASVFFLAHGGRTFAVTASHVYDAFVAAKTISRRRIACQIGNLPFDLEVRAAVQTKTSISRRST
jgi:hypothetical protein